MYSNYRSSKFRSLAILMCILASVATAFGQNSTGWSQNVSPLPKPSGPVGDFADVIDAQTEAGLDRKLRDFFGRTGVPIAVATVKTTGDRDIFDYTVAVARGWGIGTKADDNPGLLMLIAIDDRKYFTQVSKDLEDELPDGVVGSLQRQFLVPEFRNGNYGKGIADTIDAYISTIEQKTSGFAPPAPAAGTTQDESGSPSLFSIFCCLAVMLFIILLVWSNRSNGRKSKDDDDRWSGGGGGIVDALPWIILGSSTSGGSSSSSSWGSSDWGSSSGGSDWGGFGGGGDFGGGGAGGDW
jgi:uncharacterized protein